MILLPNTPSQSFVQFQSVGGGSAGTKSSLAWTHTLPNVSNGYLIVFLVTYGSSTTSTAKIGSTNIPQLGSYVTWNDGGTYVLSAFGIATSVTGSATITGTFSGPNNNSGNSIFYSNVDSSSITTDSLTGFGPWSDTVTFPANGYVSHAFGSRELQTSSAGGTLRYKADNMYAALYMQDSNVSPTTFTGADTTRGWSAFSVKMAPK